MAKKTHKRKVAKRYEMVKFESSLFEGEFTLPKQSQMPIGVVEAMQAGEVQKLTGWLADAGADQADVDAFRELSGDELETFIKDWGSGDLANAPKSSA